MHNIQIPCPWTATSGIYEYPDVKMKAIALPLTSMRVRLSDEPQRKVSNLDVDLQNAVLAL